MEIVDFSQVLQQSTSGRSLGDEILGSVVRAGIIAASLIQRDVRADATSVAGFCDRWFVQPGNDNFVVGLTDEDAAGFTEVFFGAPAVREARSLAPVERRVLGTYLTIFLAPIANALDRPISVESALVEAVEPPANVDWLRFGVTFTIDETPLACTIAVREMRAAGLSAVDAAPSASVEDIAVDAEVALRGIRIAWGDLAQLSVGDVINCGIAEDRPITAWVANRPAFEGRVTATDEGFLYEITTSNLERIG